MADGTNSSYVDKEAKSSENLTIRMLRFYKEKDRTQSMKVSEAGKLKNFGKNLEELREGKDVTVIPAIDNQRNQSRTD